MRHDRPPSSVIPAPSCHPGPRPGIHAAWIAGRARDDIRERNDIRQRNDIREREMMAW